jgi:hypothetical protein
LELTLRIRPIILADRISHLGSLGRHAGDGAGEANRNLSFHPRELSSDPSFFVLSSFGARG